MASPTKKHKTRRVAKIVKSGQARKNQVRLHGTTPASLPLNKPNANELAQKAKA